MDENNSHGVFVGKLQKGISPNEKYIEAINRILKNIEENNIDSDSELYASLSKYVDEIHQKYGERLSFDADYLIPKDSIDYLKVLLNAIKKRTNHVPEDLLNELLEIANQLKEKDQTDQTDVTYDDNLPNDRG